MVEAARSGIPPCSRSRGTRSGQFRRFRRELQLHSASSSFFVYCFTRDDFAWWNADEVFHGQRLQLHADREAPLRLGIRVAGFERERAGVMNRMWSVQHSRHGCTFDDWQNTLHAFARDAGPVAAFASIIYRFVEKRSIPEFSTRSMASSDLIHASTQSRCSSS